VVLAAVFQSLSQRGAQARVLGNHENGNWHKVSLAWRGV